MTDPKPDDPIEFTVGDELHTPEGVPTAPPSLVEPPRVNTNFERRIPEPEPPRVNTNRPPALEFVVPPPRVNTNFHRPPESSDELRISLTEGDDEDGAEVDPLA